MNWWKTVLAVATGILIAFAVIMGACKIGYDRDDKESRMRRWEQIASQYQERTGITWTAEDMERDYQEDQAKKRR